jgi:hypothetical protein
MSDDIFKAALDKIEEVSAERDAALAEVARLKDEVTDLQIKVGLRDAQIAQLKAGDA